jgi:hypothetical protein
LQGSNDDSDWTTVLEFNLDREALKEFTFEVNSEIPYKYWRILQPNYSYLIIR